jgi:hypothetical protein
MGREAANHCNGVIFHEWSFSCKILHLDKFFLPMATHKSNPSTNYKHFRKAIAFPFRKLELCRHCRFRAGWFSGLSPRIQVLEHMPFWPPWSFYPKTVEITCPKRNAYKLIYKSYTTCIQALSCIKFRWNTASRNIYFEFFKMSGFTRARVHCAIIGQWEAPVAGMTSNSRV